MILLIFYELLATEMVYFQIYRQSYFNDILWLILLNIKNKYWYEIFI